jgi:ribonucleoside-diphosphate reductase alpha chain
MGADTTGVEPQFSLVQYKQLAGGGSLRIINHGVPNALRRLGYSDKETERIQEYIMGTASLRNCPTISSKVLKAAGFDAAKIKSIEANFPDVFDIRSAFAPSILGEEFCTGTLGMSTEQYEDPFYDTLGSLGFSNTEIDQANDHVFGYGTIEGSPGLKDEHLAVFDCATPCGKYGERSIDWKAHVMMMASAQPFISGAISKTINMPADATIEEIRAAYELSHETMNKACAVYRDGSKLSQPLMNKLVDATSISDEDEENEAVTVVHKMVEETAAALPIPAPAATVLAEQFVHNYIATRCPLPDVRSSSTMKARVGGHTVYLSSSTYDDSRLGEIMITTSKEGAAWRSLLNQFAIAVSIGLQYGVPLEAFVKSFTFQKFEPSGMVSGGSGRVKMATSIVDYIFRELAIQYLDRDDLAHVSAEDMETTSISRPEQTDDGVVRTQGERRNVQLTLNAVTPTEDNDSRIRRLARERGFTGDICDDCGGSQMQRSGTCLKCAECGSTTGCS